MLEIEYAARVEQRYGISSRRSVEDIVASVTSLVVGRVTKECCPIGSSRDDRVVVDVQRTVPITGLVAAVAAVMDDLPVSGAISLDQGIPVDVRLAVRGIGADDYTVLA